MFLQLRALSARCPAPLLAICLALSACSPAKRSTPEAGPARPRAAPQVLIETAGGRALTVTVELARNDAERQRGLMYRESLEPDHGMLFLFDEAAPHAFWMKNTLIPLDMIFIDGVGQIAGVVERAEPLSTTPRIAGGPSRYVLEVIGGWCAAHGVGAGDRVRFESLNP
jgi:uncharacterized membrane protein (UPF0127 family)